MVSGTPPPLHPRERDPVPITEKMVGPCGQSPSVRKMCPPTGFEPPDSTTQFNNFYLAHFVQQTLNRDVSNDSSRYEWGAVLYVEQNFRMIGLFREKRHD